jgi:hypothetical protein
MTKLEPVEEGLLALAAQELVDDDLDDFDLLEDV